MALWLGAPPTAEIRTKVATNLADQIEALIHATEGMTSSDLAGHCPDNKHCPASIDFVGGVGLVYLFEALAGSGHADTALRLALKTSYPSFGYMFYNELEPSTSLWELWDSDIGDPTMDSRNHIYSASVSTFFYKVLGGIRATAPGYATATIAPFVPHSSAAEPAALRSVEASLGTPHGPIVSSWTTRILGPRPVPPAPQPPPSPPASCTGAVATCGMQEEGNCPSCGKVRRHDTGAVCIAFFSRCC